MQSIFLGSSTVDFQQAIIDLVQEFNVRNVDG
jgi:hypothetical protein